MNNETLNMTFSLSPNGRLRVTESVACNGYWEEQTWLGKSAHAELRSRGIESVTVNGKRFIINTNNKRGMT